MNGGHMNDTMIARPLQQIIIDKKAGLFETSNKNTSMGINFAVKKIVVVHLQLKSHKAANFGKIIL